MRGWAAAALLLGGGAAAQQIYGPQTVETVALKELREGHYLAAVRGFETHAFDREGKPVENAAFGSWQQYAPMLSERRVAVTAEKTSHLAPGEAAGLRSFAHVDAIAEITRRARLTRVVILNEGHSDPQGRAFGLAVARALYPLGYRTLAVETLDNVADDTVSAAMMTKLQHDGFVRHTTGVYLNDPAFGDFLRQPLALGYPLVAYEQTYEPTSDWTDRDAREQAQADFLSRRAVPKRVGDGKLLIFVGYGHVAEEPVEGGKRRMAARLKA